MAVKSSKFSAQSSTQALLKILIGAAWIDGTVQPEERKYLRQLAEEQGLANDPELKPLLYELIQVKPEQCYAWIEDYLSHAASPQACQELLEAISGLIYSDGSVEIEEAKLLNRIQEIEAACDMTKSMPKALLGSVQKMYRNWLGKLESLAP